METIKLDFPHQWNKSELTETIAAIGFFDGIHRGHQKLIQSAITKAREEGKDSAVITFFPHPSVVLKKENSLTNYLTPIPEKQKILEGMGVDKLYLINFNQVLSKVEPEEFINHFIIGMNVKHLVAGFDFSYGYRGKGSMNTIKEHAKGEFNYTTIKPVKENEEKISSTLIRNHLINGCIQEANHLLGRSYRVRGVVVQGDKRGRTIGFPTANLKLNDDFFLPRVGVYAVAVHLNNKRLYGMANLGYKPTFKQKELKPSIEVNILDFNEDIYGEELVIEWLTYIREEKKFNGIEELVTQIKLDEKEIRTYLQTN